MDGRTLLLIPLLLAGAVWMAGCEKPLFPERLPRTQFERADRLRGEYAPEKRRGPHGDAQPALRERLTPYD